MAVEKQEKFFLGYTTGLKTEIMVLSKFAKLKTKTNSFRRLPLRITMLGLDLGTKTTASSSALNEKATVVRVGVRLNLSEFFLLFKEKSIAAIKSFFYVVENSA